MEQHPHPSRPPVEKIDGVGPNEGWGDWDAAPRDGPSVFVINLDPQANHPSRGHLHVHRPRGRWLDPTVDSQTFREQLTELLGRTPEEGTWAVVDQVGLGSIMFSETFDAHELGRVLAEHRDASS